MQDIQILYVPESHRLEIILKSALDLPTVKASTTEAHRAIEKYQCPKVLFDIRRTISIISAAQNFEIAQDLSAFGWRPNHKWAILYQNDPHLYEVAAQLIKHKGIENVSFFKDWHKAIEWLD